MTLKHADEKPFIDFSQLQKTKETNSNTTLSNQTMKTIEKSKDKVAPVKARRTRRQGGKLKLSEEEMKREKEAMRSQYENPPECDDFEIIVERSKKFNK